MGESYSGNPIKWVSHFQRKEDGSITVVFEFSAGLSDAFIESVVEAAAIVISRWHVESGGSGLVLNKVEVGDG